MKKLISAMLAASMLFLFAACSEKSPSGETAEKLTVGIIQYMSHPSLDNCRNGLEAELREKLGEKVEIVTELGNGESATCDTIAKNMVSKKYDMIAAIATPAAMSAYAAAAGTKIPVIFCAVSDPVSAGLAESLEAPGGNCSGTSDILDFDAQLALIRAMQPEAKTIGVLYTTSETNSVSQLGEFTEKAEKAGFKVEAQGVQTAADIPQAAASLIAKVDCLNNFTDNNVVNNLKTVLELANKANVPVYGSEEEQVKNGCIACVGIDYVALGKATGDMAAAVLAGADTAVTPVQRIKEATPIINSEAAEAFGIKIPEEYSSAVLVTTNK